MTWLRSALVVAAVSGCGSPQPQPPPAPAKPEPAARSAPADGELTMCVYRLPAQLDPALAVSTSSQPLVEAMFDGLVIAGEHGAFEPSLARRWTASADRRTWTFQLREDARWSDGRPIVADDVVRSAARQLWATTRAPLPDRLWPVRNGREYADNRVKIVQRDSGPFRAGEIVHLVDEGEPDSNLWVTKVASQLRGRPDDSAAVVARAPRGGLVHVLDREPTGRWLLAWVPTTASGDGVRGWIPAAQVEPKFADWSYEVRSDSGTTGTLAGRDLLTLPEALGIRAVGDHELVIELEQPDPEFLYVAASNQFRPIPFDSWIEHGADWTAPQTIVTSGPFHPVERSGDRLELARSDTFWGASSLRLARVVMLADESVEVAVDRYRDGDCDVSTAFDLKKVDGDPPAGVEVSPYLGTYLVLLNTKQLANVHLRRALAYGLDRRAVVEVLDLRWPTASLAPGVPRADLPPELAARCASPGPFALPRGDDCYVAAPGLAFDPDAAAREWALAKRELGGKMPDRLEYKLNPVVGHRLIGRELARQWRERFGLEVDLVEVEWPQFLGDTNTGAYQLARMGWILTSPVVETELLPQFTCSAPDNRTGFCNAGFDALLARIRSSTDSGERIRLARQAEALVLEQAPVIPIYVYEKQRLRRPHVRGLPAPLDGSVSLRRVWIDQPRR